MNYTLNLIDHEIKLLQTKIEKTDSSQLTEPATITIQKNLIKELELSKAIIKDTYHKFNPFY